MVFLLLNALAFLKGQEMICKFIHQYLEEVDLLLVKLEHLHPFPHLLTLLVNPFSFIIKYIIIFF
jgi:hypothetical protein